MSDIKKVKQAGWKDHLMLDIPAMDEQHTGFFRLLEEMTIHDGKKDEATRQKCMVIIHRLEDYLKDHFKAEEDLMKKAGYAKLEMHVAQHQYFIKKIEEYKHELSFDSTFLFDKLIAFMKKWFLSHIMHTDSLYREEVKKIMKT